MFWKIRLFCLASAQKVNFDKSQVVFLRNINPECVTEMAGTLGLQNVDKLSSYMVFHLSLSNKDSKSLKFILDIVKSKLAG